MRKGKATIIYAARNGVQVENPPEGLLQNLRRFDHKEGQYENLYVLSKDGGVLSTLPGFLPRILEECRGSFVLRDRRVPLPAPDMGALDGLCKAWADPIEGALRAGGGVISMPDVLPKAETVSTIIKAYRRADMMDRGTPTTVVAMRRSGAVHMAKELQRMLPDREVDYAYRHMCSSEVMVVPFGMVKDVMGSHVGLLIGEEPDVPNDLSNMSSAARYGLVTSPSGGRSACGELMVGLFGQVFGTTFERVSELGMVARVVVCHVPTERPRMWGYGPPEVMEFVATQDEQFRRLAAMVIQAVPDSLGCVCVGDVAQIRAMSRTTGMPICGVSQIHKLESGAIRKALVCAEHVDHIPQSVVVSLSPRFTNAFPRRLARGPRDRVYLVDFTHGWDTVNGRPGYLGKMDEARSQRYRCMGFTQLAIGSVGQLPFLG